MEKLARFVEVTGRYDGVVREVWDELVAVFAKRGEQSYPQSEWLGVLGEEFGEVCRAVCEKQRADRRHEDAPVVDLRHELIQTAAMALAMLESLDRAGFDGGQ